MDIVNTVSHFSSVHENVGFTTARMQRIVGKLSSGQEVSSARDGVGEFAIASHMLAEARAISAVYDNVVQVNSLIKSMDGVLGHVEDMLIRMKTLSLEASSHYLGQSEREMLNREFQALKEEVCREVRDANKDGRYYLSSGCQPPFSDFDMRIVFPSRVPAIPPVGAGNVINPGDRFEADFVLRNSLDQPVTSIRLTQPRITNAQAVHLLGGRRGEILTANLAPGAVEATSNVEDLDVQVDRGVDPAAMIQLTLNVEFTTASGYVGRYRAIFEGRKLSELRDGDLLPILSLIPIDQDGRDIIFYDRVLNPKVGTGVNPFEDSIDITLPEAGPGWLSPNLFFAHLLDRENAEQAIETVDKSLEKIIVSRAQLGSQLERIEYAGKHILTMRMEIDAAAAKMLAADIAQRIRDYSNLNLLTQLGINAIGMGLDMHRQAQRRFVNIIDSSS